MSCFITIFWNSFEKVVTFIMAMLIRFCVMRTTAIFKFILKVMVCVLIANTSDLTIPVNRTRFIVLTY